MDENTKKLVQESWAKVVPIADQAAELFYGRLFELDPTLKFLFKAPIPVQGKLLMKALDGAVTGLNDLGALVPVDKDYDTVGAAFLWTLAQGLGEAFTDEVRAAWTEVYGVLASVMKDAQAEVVIAAAVSPREKRLVQGSWDAVVPIAETAASIFYAKLFELDPALRPMFTTDITEQGKKLMQMLMVAVKGLDRLEEIVPTLVQLGARHAGYGVKDKDYDTVAEAFLFTLGQGLGAAFTDEVKGAWVTVYTLLAGTMKSAAAQVADAAPVKELSATTSSPPSASPPATSGRSGARIGMLVVSVLIVLTLAIGYL